MVELIAPMHSRRLPFWAMVVALVISALGCVFALLWVKLPTWAPAWVVEHSPWVDPIVRAVDRDMPRDLLVSRAKQRLISWGKAAIPGLISAFESDSRRTRRLAISVLLGVEDERLIKPLLRLLIRETRDLEQEARESKGHSWFNSNQGRLGRIQDLLLRQRQDVLADAILPLPKNADVEAMVVLSLAGRVDDERMVTAMKEILWEGEDTADEFVRAVYGGRGATAAWALVRSNDASAVEVVLPAFTASSVTIRKRVVYAVLQLYRKEVDGRLGEAMCYRISDEDPDIRRAAARSMALLQVSRAEERLIDLSRRSLVKDREAAVYGLGTPYATQAAIVRLWECLSDDEEEVRWLVVRSLGRITSPKSVEPLLSALKTGTPRIRAEACSQLGRRSWETEPDIFSGLLLAIDDPDDPVSELAEKTLLVERLTPEQKSEVTLAVERQKDRRSRSVKGPAAQ